MSFRSIRASETTPDARVARTRRVPRVIAGVLIGCVVTVPAVGAAIVSGGVGHGHYTAARLLFPIPMLLTRLTDGHIGLLAGGLVLFQFPFCGGVLAWWSGRRAAQAAGIIVAAHAAAALACFAGAVPNFS